MTDARRAEVWCWLTLFYSEEADTRLFKCPRTKEDERIAAELKDAADACFARASKLDPDPELWRRSMASWADTPEGYV
jgi:hypothetical protein